MEETIATNQHVTSEERRYNIIEPENHMSQKAFRVAVGRSRNKLVDSFEKKVGNKNDFRGNLWTGHLSA